MNRLITGFTICLVMALSGTAQAVTKTWDGGAVLDNNWSAAVNWDPTGAGNGTAVSQGDNIVITGHVDSMSATSVYDSSAPAGPYGTFTLGGSMTLDVDTDELSFSSITLTGTNGSATVQGDSDWSGTSLAISATGAGATVTLTKAGSNKLTSSGQVTITGGTTATEHAQCTVSAGTLDVNAEVELNGDANEDSDATMEVSSGATFEPNSMDLNGDAHAADGYAKLVFDADVTVQTNTGVAATGYVRVDIDAGETFYAKEVSIGDASNFGNFDMVTGTGTILATKLTVKGDASNNTSLAVSAGTFQTW